MKAAAHDAADLQLVLREQDGVGVLHLRPAPAAPQGRQPATCRPTARASTSGRATWPARSTRRSSTPPAATSSTGTTSRRRTSRPVTSGWSESSLQRQKLLTGELDRRPQQTLASVLAAANAAATEDVRIVEFWPTLKAMLDKGKAPSARAKKLVAILQAWHDAGGEPARRQPGRQDRRPRRADPRRGLAGHQLGRPVRPPRQRAVHAARGPHRPLRPAPGRPVRRLAPVHVEGPPRDAGPEGQGQVPPPLLRRRHVKQCSKELWAALDAAGKKLAGQQGADPAAWRKPEAPEAIHFTPLPLTTMDYTNKPTGIHQVVTYGG